MIQGMYNFKVISDTYIDFTYWKYKPGNSSSTGIVVMFSMLEIVVEFSRIGWVVVSKFCETDVVFPSDAIVDVETLDWEGVLGDILFGLGLGCLGLGCSGLGCLGLGCLGLGLGLGIGFIGYGSRGYEG